MKQLVWMFFSLFFGFFVLTFEFQYSIIPNIYEFINPLMESWIYFSGTHFFGVEKGFNPEISSDSLGLYLHLLHLVFISLVGAILTTKIFEINHLNLQHRLLTVIAYYLSLQLLIYGFDKLFKAQFFSPEPNTLFTPIKDVSKDLLYWTTLGVSRGYSIFIGSIEIIAAGLLLFHRTRLIGAIVGIGVMLNVVAVNFGFNISVKVYSLFLLGCFLSLLTPYIRFFVGVFIRKKAEALPPQKVFFSKVNKVQQKVLKAGILLLFITEALYPFVKTRNFNDDTFPRPIFHGAYQLLNSSDELKRVFVHRHGYLIFQNRNDEFQDFQLEVDTTRKIMRVVDYRKNTEDLLHYDVENNSLISMSGNIGGREIRARLRKVEVERAPLFDNKFTWISN